MKRPIYYDTETTGTKFDKDRIIEIAAYDPVEKRSFCSFVQPGFPIPPESTKIHNITDAMVAEAPDFKEVAKELVSFCPQNTVLIAHNNDGFDRLFLEAEFQRAQVDLPAWEYIDSLKWARRYRSDLPRHSLGHLREEYGIAPNQAHRALDDVMVLFEVFSKMTDDLTLEVILKLLSAPKLIQRMPFGKYQGKLLKEIPKSYIEWLADTGAFDKPQNKELKESLETLSLLT